MKAKVLNAYGILMRTNALRKEVPGYTYEFAQRTTFVVDKQGVIKHIEEGDSAVDPYNAVTVCNLLHRKNAN